jgi:ABC-2 type transport system ATP-binding protein
MTQNLSIYPDLTVAENFRYFAAINRVPGNDIKPMLDQLHLTEVQHHLISHISGGQKTRVSLGCALIANPRLLVLDEPTVGIDPVLRAEIWSYLRELASRGTTLLISSHVMDEASHCDSLILLRDGRLLATGIPDELMKNTHTQTVEQAFLKLVGDHS